jgi:prophage DNA circulation protein
LQWAPTPRLGLQAVLDAFDFSTIAVRPRRRRRRLGSSSRPTTTRSISISERRRSCRPRSSPATRRTRVHHLRASASRRSTAPTSDQVADPTPIGFDSYDEAIAFRDQIFDAIDAQAAIAPDDDVYSALMDVRAQLAAAVPGTAVDLPRLVHVTPATTVPALVLAYRLYGDVDLADDLAARNRVARPGFVPGGRQLQVLTHA